MVWMSFDGRAGKRFDRGSVGHYEPKGRMLGFGAQWVLPGWDRFTRPYSFRCVSRRSGVSCRNHDGHGWWLDRKSGVGIV
jgi:hypothetical protein